MLRNLLPIMLLLGLVAVVMTACVPVTGVAGSPGTDSASTDATPAGYAPGSINGCVWHDLCAVSSEGGSIKPSAGCVQAGLAYRANAVLDTDEPPIGGVKVTLGAGVCPSSGLNETTTITTDLSYSFVGLNAGTYCVSIDPSQEPNAPKLQPGSWTYPATGDGPISTTISLKAGENKFDVNFGWDYRFLPPVDEACVDRPSLVADVTVPDNTVIAPGARFTKTWRVRNDGNCTWGPGLTLHALYFVNGTQLGAPTEVPLAQNVPPDSTFDVSIEMVAPNQAGMYRSEWMFHIADGPLLGVGADRQTPLAAQIIVGTEDTSSAAPAAFCTKPVTLDVKAGKVSYNGITLSVDPALAKSVTAQGCPVAPYRENREPGEAHPAYTVFKFPTDRQRIDFRPEVRVYSVEGDLQSYLYPLNALGDLKNTIDQRPEPVTWFDGALLHVHRNYLDFANGAGVRGVVQYAQDYFFFTNNGLLYEFDGLTSDGRSYINVRFPIATSFLMDIEHSDPGTNVNSHAIGIPNWPNDYNEQGKIITAYNEEALRRFGTMAESDFTPHLAALDALVQSLEITSP